MKTINFFLFILIFQVSFGQEYKGNIKSVSTNGLHKILLSPEIRTASENDIAHIRIFDANKKEVPYVFFGGNFSESSAINFPILAKEAIKNVSTYVILSNEEAKNIDNLVLKIANTDVSKKYNIYGSNDKKEWFGLVNNQIISGLNDSSGTSVERLFSFPLNNYTYLKFEFIDKNSLPINILDANLYSNSISNQPKIEIGTFQIKVTSNKEKKQTEMEITFPEAQVIDEIKFSILAPNFYLRDAEILVNKTRKVKNREESYQELFSSFQLDSKKTNQFRINELFAKQFTIVIHNADNPELTINKLELFQDQSSLIADLKSNENYTIIVDNKLNAPIYDLAQSGIDLDAKYPTTSITDLEKISKVEQIVTPKSFWQTSTFMWICIVLVVLILGFFSLSMIKDLGKEK